MSGPQPPYPYYPQQPQYPPSWQYQREGIAVTTGYSPLSWAFALLKPKVVVNGAEMPTTGWGRTFVPTPPGQYHVHVHVPYFLPRRIGPADIAVNVASGQWVELEYKAPVWNFSPGSLGPPPQAPNGLAVMLFATFAMLAVVFGFGVAFILVLSV
jgi:hypothetical protein